MKKYVITCFFGLSLLIVFSSCDSKRQRLLSGIDHAEQDLFNGNNNYHVNIMKCNNLIQQYEIYANTFPEDTLGAEFLFKAADLYNSTKQPDAALGEYARLMTHYPKYSKIPMCYFLTAFVYENSLHNYVKAAEWYNQFIALYPDHPMVHDAKVSLQNLGKSPDQMVREFEERLHAGDKDKNDVPAVNNYAQPRKRTKVLVPGTVPRYQ
jgi:tetratricopeptide (TPR) repeat protein